MRSVSERAVCSASIVLSFLLLLLCTFAQAEFEFTGHVKYQPVLSHLPAGALQREFASSSWLHTQIVDLRANGEYRRDRFGVVVHGESVSNGGTAYETSQALQGVFGYNPQRILNDERRLFDLSKQSVSDEQFTMFQRLDRAEVGYFGDEFVFRAGRQAYTLGNGLVFQTLDLFNPFSPVEIDKDYKSGEDLVYAEYLFSEGDSLELVYVPRRDGQGDVTQEVASHALVLNTTFPVTDTNIQLFGAQHFDEWNFGIGSSTAVSESVLRSDLLLVRSEEDENEWVPSFVANLDSSWVVFGKNTYTYAEYYRNGFGISRKNYRERAQALTDRVSRGEVFVFGRDVFALGGRLELTPLLNALTNFIFQLNDGSGFAQVRMQYDTSQNSDIQFGVNMPYGRKGSEFGGVEVAPGSYLRPAPELYLRAGYYF